MEETPTINNQTPKRWAFSKRNETQAASVEPEPTAGEQNVDGKMKLSQMVAAQYLILQEAPTNSGAHNRPV